jgi:hypothetical protein
MASMLRSGGQADIRLSAVPPTELAPIGIAVREGLADHDLSDVLSVRAHNRQKSVISITTSTLDCDFPVIEELTPPLRSLSGELPLVASAADVGHRLRRVVAYRAILLVVHP